MNVNQVVIYRHQLFKASEVFIHDQTRFLKAFEPIFAGRQIIGQPHLGDEVKSIVTKSGILGKFAAWNHSLFAQPTSLTKSLQNRRVSLIHAHFGVEGVFALGLARKLGVPLVTTFHGYDASLGKAALIKSGKPGWMRYALCRERLAAQGAKFICVSQHIQRKVLGMGFPASKTIQHYIGVDTQSIRAASRADNGQKIIHVARLVEKKGTRYLIEAFAKVSAKHPDAELVIIGDGPLRSELEKRVVDLGLLNRVRFLGFQSHENVLREISKSSILCLPSVTASTGDSEGLGMVLLEASAMEVPVVGTRHGGIVEAVVEGETGFLVEERNVTELAERLERLLADGNLRLAMGKQAREHVVKNFDLAVQTAKLEDIYRSCL